MNPGFWKNRSVFLTGHTGFKGGWTALLLSQMGAKVYGYSLEPPTKPSFFTETKLETCLSKSTIANILDLKLLTQAMSEAKPSIVIHMAAQPLVRKSYSEPLETFTTNIIGTVNVFEAAKHIETIKAVINVTTDKCYENYEQALPYRENDPLGGYDPYSSSKACAEIVTSAYRKSFFTELGIQLASVRAGNVIGGGDWAADRLIPDFFRALDDNKTLQVRSPNAIRPWQHVLEPIFGYLVLAEKLVEDNSNYSEAWNFGPLEDDIKSVSWIAERLCAKIPNSNWETISSSHLHEAKLLSLDISKARSRLNWSPRWSLSTALDATIDWHQAWKEGRSMKEISINQIKFYITA